MPDRMALEKMISGRVRAFRVKGRLWTPATKYFPNTVMYDWATIVSQLLTLGAINYRIGGFYIEYQNVSNPDVPVTPPAYDRSDGVSYYNSLSSSANTDYLALPLTASSVSYSDQTLFPGGNVMTFYARTQGVSGVHGKPFSDAANSVVYGGALVAIVNPADRAEDLVFSRFYFPTDQQQIKLPTSQIGLGWSLTLQ